MSTGCSRLLVANRGEIARRVFATARAMGIETVAIHSDGDAGAPFVADADQAIAIGGTTAAESYLDQAKVLDAAARSGADAIHPGYGFLSENAGFARAVLDAGLTWVGPSPEAIAAMGDKLEAKKLMVAAGVPTLPSVEVADGVDLAAAAAEIGYPVLVKAAAGGGGKGMRVVDDPDGLTDAVAGAQREAEASFGDGTVFLEKYLVAPHHVEIQVLGDTHGNLVHCFERECSIQRRHQKIIEEAPSPAVGPELRAAMGRAALDAVRAVGYHSTGTVEFLVADEADGSQSFYFLEVNTRLQVEHPVTEEVTGLDLVRQQLLVAQGEPLAFTQDDLSMTGHAIEARLYAEDPSNGFLPATGTLRAFGLADGFEARLDSGVEAGSVVGVDFDPMLAKVIASGPTRREAALRLALVLERMAMAGVVTNRDFLVATLRHEAFLAGETTTDFIDRHDPGAATGTVGGDEVTRLAIVATLVRQARNRAEAGTLGFLRAGFRNSVMPPEQMLLRRGERDLTVGYRSQRDGSFEVAVDDGVAVIARLLSAGPPNGLGGGRSRRGVVTGGVHGPDGVVADGSSVVDATIGGVHGPDGIVADGSSVVDVVIDGIRSRYTVVVDGVSWHVQGPNGRADFVERSRFPDTGGGTVAGAQVAPMPGTVRVVAVAEGDVVAAGQTLVVMEAMKMEHTVTAPEAGTVTEVRCGAGDQVDNGEVLVVVTPAAAAEPADAQEAETSSPE